MTADDELRAAIAQEIENGNAELLEQLLALLDADQRAFEIADAVIARASRPN